MCLWADQFSSHENAEMTWEREHAFCPKLIQGARASRTSCTMPLVPDWWHLWQLSFRILHRWFLWFYGAGCKNLVHYSLLSLFTGSFFFFLSQDIAKCFLYIFQHCSLIIFFLLIAIHDCIPALIWPNTGHSKIWAASVALVVQQPLKVLSQNLQVAIYAPPFLASDEFETVKYYQI